MFENLSDKLALVFKKLKGHGKLSENNIEEGLKEVRMALKPMSITGLLKSLLLR